MRHTRHGAWATGWAVAIGVLAATSATRAQQVQWTGTLRCGLIPGVTTKYLVQPLTLIVNGNQAHYSRQVHITDTSAESRFAEQGEGAVAPDGSLTLRGGAIGKGFQYTSTYQGVLPPQGGSARFTGVQLWTTRRIAQVQRACTIDLAR